MSTSTDGINISTCANCGKGEESSGELKACMACKLVKYCSRDCQKAHRSQHKRECRKRSAELHDEALLKQPPQLGECPICFLRLPSLKSGSRYKSCCGKSICSGCIHAPVYDNNGNKVEKKCPFCRAPTPTSDEEVMKRMQKRVEVGDAQAIHSLGCDYDEGIYGFRQDGDKALSLWHRAAELGHPVSYYNIGCAYRHGRGVERDMRKAVHYYELAAMGGDVWARNNLGAFEGDAGNMGRALKHFMIAVEFGDHDSVKNIQKMFKDGHATKDDYAKALQAYQAYLSEIKSDDRDKAAAFDDEYKYYE